MNVNTNTTTKNLLDTPIEYLKGVGPKRAEILNKELQIFTFGDLLNHFPFRYIDKTKVHLVSEISPESTFIQIKGKLSMPILIGEGRGKRLSAFLTDENHDSIELSMVSERRRRKNLPQSRRHLHSLWQTQSV
jgi:ATP-dependent DNA helicase RecG